MSYSAIEGIEGIDDWLRDNDRIGKWYIIEG